MYLEPGNEMHDAVWLQYYMRNSWRCT